MKNLILALATVGLISLIYSCTPKVAESTAPVATAPVKPMAKPLTDCETWLGKPNQSEAEDNHVLYRDAIKQGDFDAAFPMWEKAYMIGPAADGRRDYHFTDGAKIYADKLAKATDETEKRAHIAKIEALYDEAAGCFPENASKYYGLLAFDQYYKYEGLVDRMGVYNTFKKSVDLRPESMHYFTVNPFTAVLIEMIVQEKIPMAEGQKYVQHIKNSIAHGKSTCKNARECEPWKIIEDYAPLRLADLEGIEGFYDCAYYKSVYLADFEANQSDCEVVQLTYGRLKWGGCTADDPTFARVKSVRDQNCAPEPIPVAGPGPVKRAYEALREARYQEAVDNFQEAISVSSKPANQAKYALLIAKVYYAHLKNYPESRKWARESIQYDGTNGEPYILIGKLYASSGPLCGPGRGWDSQIVTWPAIDKWQKAKSVDPSVAAEANKLINRYRQYMPDGGEIFQRNLTVGQSFRVRCWIQENTTIRKAP